MADNLEDLNRKLEEAQQKAVDAEKRYSSTRDELSKIGNNYYATTMLTIQEQENVIKKYKELRQTMNKEIERRNVLNKALDEETKVERQKVEKAKQEVSEIQKKIEDAKKPKGFNAFLNRIGFTDIPSEDLMATQYRARHMSSGLNALFRGDIGSGLTELLSVSKKFSNFMGGAFYTAMVGAARAAIQLQDAFYQFRIASSRISGGATDELNNRYKREFQTSVIMRSYGQTEEDWKNFAVQNIGWRGRNRLYSSNRQFVGSVEALGFTRAGFQQIGANQDLANNLITQQRILGINPEAMKRFNYRLIETTKTLDKIGSEKFINSYEELNKTLIANNINGIASAKMLAKFQDQLSKGTLTISDFTSGLTSRRGAETSTLAGVGAMLAERGLGGKELQEAYTRGDMIAVAGIMRRGGSKMQKEVEKIAPEIAQQLGTSDWREALALQAGTPWGQLTGNLKNLEVQNILVSGGSLMATLEGTSKEIKNEQEKLDEYVKQLAKEQQQNKGFWQILGEAFKIGYKGAVAYAEEKPMQAYATFTAPLNPATAPFIIRNIFTVGSPDKTTTE